MNKFEKHIRETYIHPVNRRC